jgi:hypothetical protein
MTADWPVALTPAFFICRSLMFRSLFEGRGIEVRLEPKDDVEHIKMRGREKNIPLLIENLLKL